MILMYRKALSEEEKFSESMAEDIEDSISYYNYYEVSLHRYKTKFVAVEILVPLTKHINRTFTIKVPYEMMDEDNTTLLHYFKKEIYPYYEDIYAFKDEYSEIYDEYIEKSISYNLSAWYEEFLLIDSEDMDYIINNHTLYGLLDAYKSYDDRIKRIKPSDYLNLYKFDKNVVQKAIKKEKNFFPCNMTRERIRKLIKQSYSNAAKMSPQQFSLQETKAAVRGRYYELLYEGKAENIIIHFWFDFESNKIKTAYPQFS